ncbi:MAG: malate synthase A [Deinococcales bacterium]
MALLIADTQRHLADIQEEILTPKAKEFLDYLHHEFERTRQELLSLRREKQHSLNRGMLMGFLPSTRHIRHSDWQVASCPSDLLDRRVEITGPAEPKMMINALNSGAKVFMADLEDSLSPTWENILIAQKSLKDVVRHDLVFEDEEKGKRYELNDQIATLLVRPRGLHLDEKHFTVEAQPISASLFDFGLYMFHNAQERVLRGSAPYFYLPKMESHLEARLWADIIHHAEAYLGIPRGSVRVTVLIETIHAAFEMEEILFELKDYISGLNAGRWDYIFSFIKAFHRHEDFILPDRNQVTMTVPFMKAYTELMVKTCHRRGAHAIGGMAAFIPNRRDIAVTEEALRKVSADKQREAQQGCDGTWVAHPDLIPTAMAEFDKVLGQNPHQKARQREDVDVNSSDLLNTHIVGGQVTEAGVRLNINVALQYINAWLGGLGAAAIHNLMEDAATAEISRAQLWQWLKHEVILADGRKFNEALYRQWHVEELGQLDGDYLEEASQILNELVISERFKRFLTLRAYEFLP